MKEINIYEYSIHQYQNKIKFFCNMTGN